MGQYYVEFYIPNQKARGWFDRIINRTSLLIRIRSGYGGKIKRDIERDDSVRGRFYFMYLQSKESFFKLKENLERKGLDVKTVQRENSKDDAANFQPSNTRKDLLNKLGLK